MVKCQATSSTAPHVLAGKWKERLEKGEEKQICGRILKIASPPCRSCSNLGKEGPENKSLAWLNCAILPNSVNALGLNHPIVNREREKNQKRGRREKDEKKGIRGKGKREKMMNDRDGLLQSTLV